VTSVLFFNSSTESAVQRQKKENLDELDIVGNLYNSLVIEFNRVLKQLGIG
jgi:hypothetical protein